MRRGMIADCHCPRVCLGVFRLHERDGKVVAGQAEPGGGPDRKLYAITTAGAAEVGAWLTEPG
jgi:DNA-binding PadR family transcriptional regulator